jgi:ATP-binding cassette, subfamily B, bacterial
VTADAPERPDTARTPTRAVDRLDVYRADNEAPRDLRSLPRLVVAALSLVRRAGGRTFYVVVGLQLLGAVLVAVQVVVAQRALQGVVDAEAGAGVERAAVAALVALAVAFAAATLVTAVAAQVQRLLAERVLLASWRQVLDVTTSVDLLTFDDPAFHEQQQRVQLNAINRPVTVTEGLAGLLSGTAGLVFLVVALVSIAPEVLPVMLLGAPALWAVSRRGARLEYEFVLESTLVFRERVALRDLLTRREDAQEVRAYDSGPALRRWHDEKYDSYVQQLRRLVRRRVGLALLSAAVTVPVVVTMFGVLLWLVQSGRTSLAGAGAAAVAIRLLSGRIDQLTKGVASLYESGLFLSDLASFIARTPASAEARPDGRSAAAEPVAASPPGSRRRPFTRLALEGVGFTYPGTTRPALFDVDLEVRAGEVVALVGENGSGKTTLAKLMGQLYPPTTGRVLWDGHPVTRDELDELRRHAAVVFQDFARYPLPGHSNVSLTPPDEASLPAVVEAARRAGAHEILSRLPRDYRTVLSKAFPGGADLSGGEWQRVALARALFRDAPFLLMDEPSAALDPRAEHALFEDLRGLLADRTVVLVSHRLSSVVSADRIYVLHEGRVVEAGDHASLLRRRGLYADLFAMQAEAYRRTGSARAS